MESSEQKPVAMGVNIGPGGIAGPTYSSTPVGIKISVTSRISEDNAVLKLNLTDTRSGPGEEILNIGGSRSLVSPSFVIASVKTTLTIPLGQAVVADGVHTGDKAGQSQVYVIVAARRVEN